MFQVGKIITRSILEVGETEGLLVGQALRKTHFDGLELVPANLRLFQSEYEIAGRNVTESWLSRYLDLARLPAELMAAFAVPQDLKIKHVTAIKPLLKPEGRRQRVFTEATRLAEAQADRAVPMPVPDVIRALALAADPPKRSGSPKKSGKPETIVSEGGKPLLKVEAVNRKGLKLTLLPHAGGTRVEAEAALKVLLDRHWA